MGLWHQSEDLSMTEGCRNIKQLAVNFHRKSDKQQGIHIRCLPGDLKKRTFGLCQKTALPEQILTGIACDTKLRKHHHSGAESLHFPYFGKNCRLICCGIRHTDFRDRRCDPDKSILHPRLSFSSSYLVHCLYSALISSTENV